MRLLPGYFIYITLLLIFACVALPPKSAPVSKAQQIVNAARKVHGVDTLAHARVDFDFRGKHFTAFRTDEGFLYQRMYTDSSGTVRETLKQDSVSRFIEGIGPVTLTNQQQRSLESALNSVVYFALLPFSLNDPAVQKRYLGAGQIRGEPYDKVEVTFAQQGGGRDWEDRFVYWFHQHHHTMDYLAYRFDDTRDGTRFRQAFNPRTINGVRFADYYNYNSDSLGVDIAHFDVLFEQGKLDLLSEVVLENVSVTLLR